MFRYINYIIAMVRVKRLARKLSFSKRQIFLKELQPPIGNGNRAAWPDCVMILKNSDVTRAIKKAQHPTNTEETK